MYSFVFQVFFQVIVTVLFQSVKLKNLFGNTSTKLLSTMNVIGYGVFHLNQIHFLSVMLTHIFFVHHTDTLFPTSFSSILILYLSWNSLISLASICSLVNIQSLLIFSVFCGLLTIVSVCVVVVVAV